MSDRPPGPADPGIQLVPLAFEGVTLGSSAGELIELAGARGWHHNAGGGDGDQVVTVFPGGLHPVARFELSYQAGRLVGLTAHYRQADPTRAAIHSRYPVTRHVAGRWYLADAQHETLIEIDDAGRRLRVLHTATLRDQGEVDALLRSAFADLPSTA